MFETPSSIRLRRLINRQFEPDGDGWLFRREPGMPAVRITTEEKDAFLAGYRRAQLRMTLAGVALVLLAAVAFSGTRGWPILERWFVFGPLMLAAAVALWLYFHAFNAPLRALKDRPTIGRPPLTRDEYIALKLAQISWTKLTVFWLLCLMEPALLLLFVEYPTRTRLGIGAMAVGITALFGFLAYWKRRSTQRVERP